MIKVEAWITEEQEEKIISNAIKDSLDNGLLLDTEEEEKKVRKALKIAYWWFSGEEYV